MDKHDYIIATNPGALQQPTTTPTSPTSQPTVKPAPQPTVPATSNQPAQNQDSMSSSLQIPNIYTIILAAIAAVAATVAMSYSSTSVRNDQNFCKVLTKEKLFYSGLNSIEVAMGEPKAVATTTTSTILSCFVAEMLRQLGLRVFSMSTPTSATR